MRMHANSAEGLFQKFKNPSEIRHTLGLILLCARLYDSFRFQYLLHTTWALYVCFHEELNRFPVVITRPYKVRLE